MPTWAESRPRRITREEFDDLPMVEPLDLAAVSGKAYNTILGLVHDGTLPARRVGRSWIINRRAAVAFLDGEPWPPEAETEATG